MSNVIFSNFINNYSEKDKQQIRKAYEYASLCHSGQYRQSGEEYITHPSNVALVLMEYNADVDTVCAGLLHDVLEDTKATEKEILNYFNPTVLKLVKGVTNLVTPELSKKEAQLLNIRRVISSITDDVRIIIIKLADRLHNMRTLEYKDIDKQHEKAIETLEIYAPLADCIGAYDIKCELEDLSLRFLKPDDFYEISEVSFQFKQKYNSTINEIISSMRSHFSKHRLSYKIDSRLKNIYGIYRNIRQGQIYEKMHDLIVIESLVKSYNACYEALGIVHQLYPYLDGGFKDYISTPKANMYQALHTTVFGPNKLLVQNQIRTFEMDNIAHNGLLHYWQSNSKNAHLKMQSDLNKKFQFYRALTEINHIFNNDEEFITQVHFELLDKKVYVYTDDGVQIELPDGASVVDAVYNISDDSIANINKVLVNDEEVPLSYQIRNKDRIHVITGKTSSVNYEDLINNAHTTYARQRIKELKH